MQLSTIFLLNHGGLNLLVEGTKVTDKLYLRFISANHHGQGYIKLTASVEICTDWIGKCNQTTIHLQR